MNNITISTPNEGKNAGKSFWLTIMSVYDFSKGEKTNKKKIVLQFQLAYQAQGRKVNFGNPVSRINQTVEFKNIPVAMQNFGLKFKIRVPMEKFQQVYNDVCLGKTPIKELESLLLFGRDVGGNFQPIPTLEGLSPLEDFVIYKTYTLKQQGNSKPCCDKYGNIKFVNLMTGEIQSQDKLPRKRGKEWVQFYNSLYLAQKGEERLIFENINLDKLHKKFIRGEESTIEVFDFEI